MKKSFSLLLLTALSCTGFSQGSTYQQDLDVLNAHLQKTPSFKDQVRGASRKAYDAQYQLLREELAGASNDFEAFNKLVQLFFSFRDNHLGFYQLPPIVLTPQQYQDTTAIDQYTRSPFFRQYPSWKGNLDSLATVLWKKDADSVEGIYDYGGYLTVGLFRNGPGKLTGVVLETKMPSWGKGQVAMELHEYMPGSFHAVYGHPIYKQLILTNNEKYRNHSLINSYFYSSITETVYKKFPKEKDHSKPGNEVQDFDFRNINNETQYLRLGTFQASNTVMKTAQSFYDRIQNSLSAPHLIVDLRDNNGGAKKVSKKFLQLVRDQAKKGRVSLLVNNGTMSQGEIFTLDLKGKKNIVVYGQTTRGTIAYGSNQDNRKRMPSGKFEVYLTDMNDKGYFQYEGIGVEPDVVLDGKSDWIEQVLKK